MTRTIRSPVVKRNGRRALRLLFSVHAAPVPVDLAMAAARVALAWIFIYYGAGKLFAAFNEAGIHGTALYFDNVAHLHPGGLFAVVAGVIEFGGGVAVALGFAVRLAGIALFGDMVMAMITVTWATGINSVTTPPGYQLNLALAVLALIVTLLGGGRLSVDAIIAQRLGATRPRPELEGRNLLGLGTAQRGGAELQAGTETLSSISRTCVKHRPTTKSRSSAESIPTSGTPGRT